MEDTGKDISVCEKGKPIKGQQEENPCEAKTLTKQKKTRAQTPQHQQNDTHLSVIKLSISGPNSPIKKLRLVE